jgi:tetratricopeptide (TPR) repeat protein
MSARIYEDCELVIQISGERYLAQLSNIHAGEASGEFALPFTQVELVNFYSRIGQAHRATRGGATPDVEAAKRFGDQLFRSVFAGEMLSQLRASVDHAHEHGHGLRLRLRLKNVPDLGELPWEFLYDREQDHFIATSTMTPMVRYLDLPQNVATLRVRAPLRVLVVLAGPRNLPILDAEGEWQRLKATLGPLEAAGAICLERLPDGTLATLRRRARGEPFHILHFVGHGGFDEVAGDGVLHFENAQCLSDPIAGQMLGNILRDHETLRLVVLNACEGARQSNQNPFSGVAQSLCQQRMPAVIAMQFEISDDAAKTFAEEFYGAIADGLPVDAAVSESRKALYSGRFGQEWATPVLYMRSPSGLLFDIQKRPKQPEPAKPIQQAVVAAEPPLQRAEQQSVQQSPVQRPAPPPPPPKPAFDIEAERRKLDAERARIEAERIQREKMVADAEARHHNEEERLKQERLRFEQEQAQARIAAEAQRRREEQGRREEQQRREQEEQARRERLEAQYREQERTRAEEARRNEQLRQQKEREASAAAAARSAPPPPPIKQQQPVAFASAGVVAPPQKSHRVRKSILVTFAVIGAVLLTLLIIGLIVGSNESRVNHMRAGEQAMGVRKFDEAITHFRAAVSKHPEIAETHARLCNAIALQGENSPGQKGDYAAAVAECEEAVRLKPESSEAHSNLCNALNDSENAKLDIRGDYSRAIAECRQAIKLDPKNAEAWNNLCNVVGTRGEQPGARPTDHRDAVNACNEAIRLRPDYAEAHKNLGDLYRDSGDDAMGRLQNASATQFFNQAAAEYRQAVNSRPNYELAEAQLGAVFYKNNKPQAAREELNKAISLDPNDYVAHFWLGNVYFRELKQNDQAITEFKRVVELKPDLAAGEYALSQVYRADGDSNEANTHLTNAYNRNPNDKDIAGDYKRYIASGSSSLGGAPTDQSATPAPAVADNGLDGWYFGTTRNVTFQKESRAAIYLEQNGRQLRGCLLVYPPLGGSGPLTGGVDSSTILLQAKSANYTITFSGDVAGDRIAGNYVVHWPNLQNELGNMSFTKTTQPILASINVNACPSDADNRAWAS